MSPLTPRRVLLRLAGLSLATAVAAAAGLLVGPSAVSVREAAGALLHPAAGGPAADIVLRIRLPRVGLGLAVGAALSVAGTVFQALLRNPLADPFVLGVSGGAALAGVVAMVLGGAGLLAGLSVSLAAFLGALATTAALFLLAARRGRLSPTTLLLTGVVFNAIASAAIVFLASMAGLTEGASIFLWLIGNLAGARPQAVLAVGAMLLLGLAVLVPLARGLNLLVLGEEQAAQLGLAVEPFRRVLLAATSLLVGAAVAVSGLVGFVGLIVPHGLRLLFGPDHRLLVPASALGGAAFLVLCDAGARVALGGRELPVGAITALLGGPLFLLLLLRREPWEDRG